MSQVQWTHQARGGRLVEVRGERSWKVKLAPALERDLFARPRRARKQAIKVFSATTCALAAGTGGQQGGEGLTRTRTGVKVVVVDATPARWVATNTVCIRTEPAIARLLHTPVSVQTHAACS